MFRVAPFLPIWQLNTSVPEPGSVLYAYGFVYIVNRSNLGSSI